MIKDEEKRRHRRLPVLHEIDEPIQIALNNDVVPGVLVDLSASGMSLLTYASVPVGSEVSLSVDLPGLKTRPLKGRIVWSLAKGEMWRIGISFIQIDPSDFRHINRMAIDSDDCDTKVNLGVRDVCFEDCAYFALCNKQVKLPS